MTPTVFEIASHLDADADTVWRRVCTADGVNAELWPLRMTFPRAISSVDQVRPGPRLFGSLVSLWGLVPLDWHRFGLESITPARGFHEVSSSLWMRRWVHIRSLEPHGSACTLRDHVELTPRLSFMAPLVAPIYRGVFRRRHRHLREHFGGTAGG